MKKLGFIVIIAFLLFSHALSCKEHNISILVSDSLSHPIKNAHIEIITPFYAYSNIFGVTDTNGIAKLKMPYGNYDVIVTHYKYHELKENLEIRDTNKIYQCTLQEWKDFCTLEGNLKLDIKSNRNPFINPFPNIIIHFKPIDLTIDDIPVKDIIVDTSGHYSIKIPPGKYKIKFTYHCLGVGSYENTIEANISYDKKTNICDLTLKVIKQYDPGGFGLMPSLENSNSIFDVLQYMPGVLITK